jgi:hypothetical protein
MKKKFFIRSGPFGHPASLLEAIYWYGFVVPYCAVTALPSRCREKLQVRAKAKQMVKLLEDPEMQRLRKLAGIK